MKGRPKDIKNILCIRNDRFGEFLLNIPAFRALKNSYPGSTLTLLVNPAVEKLARYIDCVDNVLNWELGRHRLGEIVAFSRTLKKQRFDLCVIFNPSKESHIISFLAGIPVRVGYARKFGFLLTHSKEDTKQSGQKHEVEYNLELVRLLGAESGDTHLSLNTQDIPLGFLDDIDTLHGSGVCFVALHPWTSDPVKQWPLERFYELSKRLLAESSVQLVVVGGKESQEQSKKIFDNLGKKLINITGETTLPQLAEVLRKCQLLISGDSGPVHLACAVGTQTLVLFRSDIPAKSAKRWGPWGKGHVVMQRESLYDIPVEEVLDKAKEILKI